MNKAKNKSRNKKYKKHKKHRKATDPHLAREKAKYGEPIASREFILQMLGDEKAPLKFDALANRLGISDDSNALDALARRVRAMLRDGQLIENRKRGLVPVDADSLIVGRINAHPDGFGFLIPDKNDGQGDLYLSGKQMRLVLHGDRAVVSLSGVDRRGRREGRIVEVVERANKSVVGRLLEEKGVIVIAPDNKRIHQDVMIPEAERGKAVHGDIVVAEIIEQPNRHNPPVGRVVEVLGKHMEAGMEIDMSLRSHDIPFEWPQVVLEQANAYSTSVSEQDKMGRKDITRLPLVTIDGADARDFDDAVYCEKTKKGWRLLVAIADVAHYVEPDTELDKEAVNRGTSVYFPGRVVPMLPEVLSNGLCSINPEVDRLCMLCEMTLDEAGGIQRARFYNAVMLSHARLTYSQVNEILTSEKSKLHDTYSEVVPHLRALHDLYKVLAANRSKRGVIEFASNETRILFDDDKKISEIVPIVRNDAHKLIEECMILANVAAAGFLEQHNIPALYRVHHGPKSDKLDDLRAFLSLRGLSIGGGDKPSTLDYAVLSKQIDDRPDKTVISTVMLRSMQQAVYQPKNEGHFGLALSQYAHFTSPIRRYPDLLVHRAIKHVLKRDSIINYRYTPKLMHALGESCSNTERRAEEATRDVVNWLKCEYMQDHIGSEYPGVITAVTSFGLFVELTDIHVEGLLHVTNLSHDYYRFEQAAQAMVGERTGKQYRLGDEIMVRVDAVNLEDRKIDFAELGVEKHDSVKSKKHKNRKDKTKKDKTKKEKFKKADKTAKFVDAKHDSTRNKKSKKPKDKHAYREFEVSGTSTTETRPKRDKLPEAPATIQLVVDNTTKETAKSQTETNKTTAKKAARKPVSANSTNTKVKSKKKISRKTSASKVAAKKTVSKKTVAKKPSSKKSTSNKKPGKKAISKKTATSGKLSKKTISKKTSSKRKSSKKAIAKKAAAKKNAGKKFVSKKTATKRKAGKKIVSKTNVTKKKLAKKASNKKSRVRSKASSKVAAKKSVSRKTSVNKVVSKKAASKKTTAKKVTRKKAMAKKRASKKVAVRKKAAKKAAI